MHDFFLPSRPPTFARDAMIATSHPLATACGLEILRQGGNAVDAAIAASATLCVVEAHMTGIGGDCFALYAPKGRPVVALNGSGRAPAAMTVECLQTAGLREIPRASPHAVTVPGAIAAWTRLHEDYGTLPLEALFRRAIDYAENGYPITPRVAADWALDCDALVESGAGTVFAPGGRTPEAGDSHMQPRLGRSLREIAKNGAKAFYTGRIAERLVDFLRRAGGLHTLEDFVEARHGATYEAPISTRYRGYDVLECPPNGQGVAALLILNILEGFDLGGDLPETDRVHLQAEATKIAYHHRDALIGDPEQCADIVARLLEKQTATTLQKGIDPARAGTHSLWGETEHKDTIYLCAVDRDGNAISFINSIFNPFGSMMMEPETGILLHNRGMSFRILPDHPNCVAPRKRPMHTIIPGMLREGDRIVSPFGVMGGHYQAAGHAAFLAAVLDRGMDVQAALSAPRSFAFDGVLEVEETLGDKVIADLAARGHVIRRRATPLGGGQAIWIDHRRGVLQGGSDHRKDGCALGF